MKVFYCSFSGCWLPGFGIIVADNQSHAAELMNKKLKEVKLKQTDPLVADDMIEINTDNAGADVIWDGNY